MMGEGSAIEKRAGEYIHRTRFDVAKILLRQSIESLTDSDKITVISFGFGPILHCYKKTKEDAVSFIDKLYEHGGTYIASTIDLLGSNKVPIDDISNTTVIILSDSDISD